MLAISGAARDLPDARVGAMLDWIEAQMLDAAHVWRNRRLILFTEWDDTRRWLVERLKEGLLQRSRGRVDLNGRILVFTGQTSLEERDRIKIAFNAPFDREPVRILVCTDAAREGLNLQARCHDLIHVDLPWNPSRLEQRNGRIDRKLQPSKVVTCRYFFYDQREEDRVLDALVRKTEVIRRQLGASGEVLRMRMEKTLTRDGIQRGQTAKLAASIDEATSEQVKVAERELGDETERRIARLKEEQARLQRALDHAKKRVGVEGADIRRVVEIALKDDGAALQPGHFSVPEAVLLDPDTPSFAKDPSWASLFDELRPGRPANPKDRARWRRETPVRGLVFEPPKVAEGQPEPQDVVQLHLEHRLIKRLISRFVSQGFRATVGRVTAIVGPNASPRVVLMGRLSLFGPAGRRLHEEIIPITAAWRDIRRDESPLAPFAEAGEATTVRQLDDALRNGAVARVGRPGSPRANGGTRHRRSSPLSGSASRRVRERGESRAGRERTSRSRGDGRAVAAADRQGAGGHAQQAAAARRRSRWTSSAHRRKKSGNRQSGRCASSRRTGGRGTASCYDCKKSWRANPRKCAEDTRCRRAGWSLSASSISGPRRTEQAHDLSRASGRNVGMAELSPAGRAGCRRERPAREGAVAHPPDAARHRRSREGASPRPGGRPRGRSASGASRPLDVFRDRCWAGLPSSSPAAPGGLRSTAMLTVTVPEHETLLSPDMAVLWNGPAPDGVPAQALVMLHPTLDADGRNLFASGEWEASPHQRLERLLRETNVGVGVLVARNTLRLIYAPRGETAGWLSWPLAALGRVEGRPMLAGLKLCLARNAFFTGAPETRLRALLEASREAQNAVSEKLSGQVLGALYELLRGLHRAAPDASRRSPSTTRIISTKAC